MTALELQPVTMQDQQVPACALCKYTSNGLMENSCSTIPVLAVYLWNLKKDNYWPIQKETV
jgi:hypothetical protein